MARNQWALYSIRLNQFIGGNMPKRQAMEAAAASGGRCIARKV